MTNATLQTKDLSTNDGVLYMAMELSHKTWKLGFSDGRSQTVREIDVTARDYDQVMDAVRRSRRRFNLDDKAPVINCYEAGREAFSVYRSCMDRGIETVVVDAASIEVPRRSRRKKTDRLDVRKLVARLIRHSRGEAGVWSVVRVPSRQDEDDRRLHRERKGLVGERVEHGNKIRSLLMTHGVVVDSVRGLRDDDVERMRLEDGSRLPEQIKAEIKRGMRRLALAEEQIKEIEEDQKRRIKEQRGEKMKKLTTLLLLRGVGIQIGWILVFEFFWRQFSNRREVGSAAGLTGTPHRSGQLDRELGISKAGNRHVRAVMIELAWLWLRYQPESKLSKWFFERFADGGKRMRKIGIVALARKLLIALWRLVEYGEVPEGAIMS
jgi:transposase